MSEKYMNIWAGDGDKVKYAYPNAGYDGDVATGKKYLVLGETYEVRKCDVGSSRTIVYLKGFEIGFNSSLFSDVSVNEEMAEARAKVWYERH